MRPRAALGSLAVSAAAVLVLYALCGAVLRSRGKGAMLAGLAALLFFSHGHWLQTVGDGPAAQYALLAGGCALWLAAAVLLARWRGDPRPWNRAVDVAAAALVLMSLVPIVSAELRPRSNITPDAQQAEVATPLGYMPDIYVIVLDAFGRADQLEEIYGVDLAPFADHLASRGFTVAEKARANYAQTSMSLAAFFNSKYLPALLSGFGPGYKDKQALNRLAQEGRQVRRLRDMGYRLVTLPGGSELAAQVDPDVSYRGGALNEFQSTLLSTTPLPLLAAMLSDDGTGALDPYTQHREGVRYQLAKLPHTIAGDGPKLVFAHILSPHPPFLMSAEGEELTPDYQFSIRERDAWRNYRAGYAGQTAWIVGELQKTVDGILANSRRPPVIVVMGDHGPASLWLDGWRRVGHFRTRDRKVMNERLSIFLALHMPPGAGGEVYPELSPVNVFPLIFARCFGETADLRPDRSFFSTYKDWATLTAVDPD